MKSPREYLLLGVMLALFSWFSFSLTNALVKLLHGNIHAFQILFLQNVFGLAAISLICMPKRGFSLASRHYPLLFLRSMSGLGAFFFVFISLQYVSVANATLLINTSPFFVPFLLLFFLKEPLRHHIWWGILPGFAGIALILRPGTGIFQWHALLPLFSGVCVATILISLRRLHHHKEPPFRVLFYLFLFAGLVSLPFGVFYWKNPSFKEWILLISICISGFVAQTAVTWGVRHASPKALAPLCYTSVVFALFFDWFIWKEVPSLLSFIGMLLVITGGIIALLLENRKKRHEIS